MHHTIPRGDEFPETDFGYGYEIEYWVVLNSDDLHIRLVVDCEEVADKDDDAGWDRNRNEGEGTNEYFLEADETLVRTAKSPTRHGEILR